MTGHPGLGWATQPPALGGPYGDTKDFDFSKALDFPGMLPIFGDGGDDACSTWHIICMQV